MACGCSGCWERSRDDGALGALHHEGIRSWCGRSVEDLDGDDVGPGLKEDLVLYVPGALRPCHHVAEGVARAVGDQDDVVLGHWLRVSQRDLDVEDAADRRYRGDAALGPAEHDCPGLSLARTDWQRQPSALPCRPWTAPS